MTIREKSKKLLCLALLGGICIPPTSQAYEPTGDEQKLKFVQTSPQVQNLDIDQLIQIEIVSREYKDRIEKCRQQVELERKKFNDSLQVKTSEEDIRSAFSPVAKAIEDVAVTQIIMMQEINLILQSQDVLKNVDGNDTLSLLQNKN